MHEALVYVDCGCPPPFTEACGGCLSTKALHAVRRQIDQGQAGVRQLLHDRSDVEANDVVGQLDQSREEPAHPDVRDGASPMRRGDEDHPVDLSVAIEKQIVAPFILRLLVGIDLIERATEQERRAAALESDIGFRYLSANQQPNFRTISDFRKDHLQLLEMLFTDVLELCAEAGQKLLHLLSTACQPLQTQLRGVMAATAKGQARVHEHGDRVGIGWRQPARTNP